MSDPAPEADVAPVEDHTDEIAELRASIDALTVERDEAIEKADTSDDVEVRKALQEEVAQLRKSERTRVFAEKAVAAKLPAEYGQLLEAADENFDDAAKTQLDGLLDQVEKGKLFAQISDPGAESIGDAKVQLAKAAKARMDEGLEPTIEQARVAAVAADPSLREAYTNNSEVR